jgi:hypothetical protein
MNVQPPTSLVFSRRAPALAAVALVLLDAPALFAQVALTTSGAPYTQDFNTLATSGTTNTALPAGWTLTESGGGTRDNEQYAADTGSSNTGDTYSYGASASAERAFGGLLSGTLVPTIGAAFTNNTGVAITAVDISYIGEQWRLGSNTRGADRLDFQYSLDATSLTSGSWSDVNALDFSTIDTSGAIGLRNGNDSAFRRTVASRILGVSIPPGATFWIRWTDFNASGADDGLAVDDFALTPNPLNPFGIGQATPNDVFPADQTLLTVTVVPGAAAVTSVVADLTAIGGASSQALVDDGTGGDVTGGDAVFSLSATVAAGTPTGSKSLPFTVTDADGRTGTGAIALLVSPVPTCTATATIAEIQGAGAVSPLAGQVVTTQGVVYAVRSSGFYVQMETGDGNAATSDGVLVFTGSAPPAAAAAGNRVCVTGTVVEFVPGADPHQAPLTEIGSSPTVIRLASNLPLPAPVPLTVTMTTAADAVARLEALEGMRVTVPSLTVTGATLGTVSEPNATATSSGVFYGVVTGVARPFREAGIDANDPIPLCAAGSNCDVPVFDTNPERLRIASTLLGQPPLDVGVGAVVTGLTGPLDYGFRTYTIGAESTTTLGISGGPSIVPVPAARPAEITAASLNLRRFFDDSDDSGISEPVLTSAAYTARLIKASRVVREVLGSPDIVGLVEIENQAAVDALAARINADAVAGGQPDPQYAGFLEEGNDIGGIDVAFLVKTTRVSPMAVTQYGKAATFVNPETGELNTLNDRPPLVLEAAAIRPNGDVFPLIVIVNHLRSLNGVETARVQAKRAAQAEFLADLVQDLQAATPGARILLVGDFNAFDVNDGYVDVLATVAGTPAPPEAVAVASGDLVDPDLANLNLRLPAGERYSYIFDGNAQTLDHALASAALAPWVSRFAYGRSNADFPEVLTGSDSAARLSDHDGAVTYVDLGTPRVSGRITGIAVDPAEPTAVQIEVTNAGDGFARDVVIEDLRLTGVKASGPVLLAPIVIGTLQPGETRTVTATTTVAVDARFTASGLGRYLTQENEQRTFVLQPVQVR